jgi:uncharacterized protein YkwD
LDQSLAKFQKAFSERIPAMPSSLCYRSAFYTLVLFVLIHAGPVASANGQKPPISLSPENRSEVNRLLQEYRAAGTDLEKKQAICQKVLAVDPAAPRLMLAAVERDLQPQLRKYCTKFQTQAAAAAKQKVGKVDMNKVVAVRKKVLDLQNLGDDFTKDVIVKKIDPTMQALREAFVFDRGEVLDKSPELQAERKKLDGLGQMWEQCQAKMQPPPGKEVAGNDDTKTAEPVTFDRYLQGEEDLAASLAIPQDPQTRAVLATNARVAEKLDPEEARAILALNLTRNLLGLPALAIDLRLCRAARDHSQDMERLNFFSHISPVPGKKTPENRAMLAGTTASRENIFSGSTSGKKADERWFHSPGHHKNQMADSARVGVGRSGTYFTEMFGN